MRKYFFIYALFSVVCIAGFSQSTRNEKIDSLKKQLPALKSKEKVDCLNFLAVNFEENLTWKQRADSGYLYASTAFEEAKKIDYKKGIARSLTNLANSEHTRGVYCRLNQKDDSETVVATEKYLSQALPLAEEIQDYETLGYANELWSDMVYIKSKFQDHNARAFYVKKAIDHFHRSGNVHKEGESCLYQGERYQLRGYYEEALNYLQPALELNKKALSEAVMKDEKEYCIYLYNQSLVDMSQLYLFAGDYQTALEYLNISQQFCDSLNVPWEFAHVKLEVFNALGQFDSSFYYINLYRKKLQDGKDPWSYLLVGTTFLKTNQPDSALFFLNQSVSYFKKRTSGMGNFNRELPDDLLLNMAEAYVAKRDFMKALAYATTGLSKAAEREKRPSLMKGFELLSKIHRNLGDNDSAYLYLLKYSTLKDSIENKQFMFRLNSLKKAIEDAKKESRIGLLNRDNEIKRQQLKQQGILRNSLIAVLILISLLAIFILRSLILKRKNDQLRSRQLENDLTLKQLEIENRKAEFQKKTAELEMQALRAQMNPHFIFNCLSSINRFIFKNDNKLASDYLTRFSRLIRMVMMNSSKKLITLEDELEMLRLYLDLERLRFKDAFDYSITTTNIVDAGNIFIPPLLLQPFCENAVWHGLMHKETKGHLNIVIREVVGDNDKTLHCIIEDDGIGRDKAAELKSKSAENEKSMGLKITTERLALLNQENNFSTFYRIEDILNENNEAAGTRVQLKLRYKDSVEEFV